MPRLRDIPLVDASVPRSATFLEATRTLSDQEISAIAVLQEDRRVAGLFTVDDVLRGLFPRYLEQLRHTAFVGQESAALEGKMSHAAAEPVTAHMREAVTVDVATAPIHVAERFLHVEWAAIAVVEERRFLGMLDQLEFCRAVMARPD